LKFLLLHNIDTIRSRFSVTPEQMEFISKYIKAHRLTFDDGYTSIYKFLYSAGKQICHKTTVFLVAAKIGALNDWDKSGELAGQPLLNWDEILELQKSGVRVGSHGLTHRDLTKLDNKELDREVKESRRILEEKLGQIVEGFAYPFGYFNQKVIDAVKAAGYKWAVTTSDSIWEGRGNPYRIRRIKISGLDSKFIIWAKITGLYDIKSFWKLPHLVSEKMTLLFKK
jgi:peptidoglycan/xylan/chitin deacetylase (PgdA/CDA1 family)